jgi:hypothetical protein
LISWIHRSPPGAFSIYDASAGSTKPGKGALVPIAAGFLRWNATVHTRHGQRQLHVVIAAFVPLDEVFQLEWHVAHLKIATVPNLVGDIG